MTLRCSKCHSELRYAHTGQYAASPDFLSAMHSEQLYYEAGDDRVGIEHHHAVCRNRECDAYAQPFRCPEAHCPFSITRFNRSVRRIAERGPYVAWQWESIDAWESNGFQGIIEAATGTGKTHAALLGLDRAAKVADERGVRLARMVVVPNVALMNQWYERLTAHGFKVGRLGGGYADGFCNLIDVLVAVVNSAVRHIEQKDLLSFATTTRGNWLTLLVADECHRYLSAPFFNRLLRFPWSWRLGLTPYAPTATPVPFQGNVNQIGDIIYELRFADAYYLGIVPEFYLLNVGVPFSGEERSRYDRLTTDISDIVNQLKNRTQREQAANLSDDDANWLEKLRDLHAGLEDDDPAKTQIERIFNLLYLRAAVYHTAKAKISVVREAVKEMVQHGRKVIVFFERISSITAGQNECVWSLAEARDIAVSLRQAAGAAVATYHSQQSAGERHQALESFRTGEARALLACRSLDEGYDQQDIDCAILAASTQSKRQRIQRLGRVLRCDPLRPRRKPIVMTIIVPDTSDLRVIDADRDLVVHEKNLFTKTEKTWLSTLQILLNE